MYSCFKFVNTMAAAFCRYFNLAVHQWNGNDESFTESWYYWSGDLSFWVANTMISLHVCWQTLNTRSACRYAYEVMSWNVLLLWAHRPSLHNLMGFFFLHFFILSLNSISSQYIVHMFYQRGLWRLHRQQWELASHFYADKLHYYSNKISSGATHMLCLCLSGWTMDNLPWKCWTSTDPGLPSMLVQQCSKQTEK